MTEVQHHEEHKRLTQEELDKQIARLTAPPRPVEVRDPFPVCPTIVLPQSEVDKMTDRLYTQSIQEKEAKRVELEKRFGDNPQHTHTEPLASDDLQGSVDRLYTQSIEHKQQSLEAATERADTNKYTPPTPVPLNDFVQHMYYDRLAAKKKTEDKLYQKYIVTTEMKTGKITRSQLAQSADRLSTKS